VNSTLTQDPEGPEAPIGVLAATGLSALVLVVLVVAVPLFGSLIAALPGAPSRGASTEVGPDRIALALAQAAGLLVALAVGLHHYRRGATLRDALHLRSVGAPQLATAAVAGFALQLPLAELGNVLHAIWPMTPAQTEAIAQLVAIRSPRDAVEVFLLLCVLAPVGEELLFRGLLLPGLRAGHGTAVALVTSAALFGAVHLEPVSASLAAVVGIVLGLLALRTGSTLPPMALHFGFNFAPVLLQRAWVRVPGFNTVGEDVYHVPLGLVVAALTVAALALLAFYRLDAEGTR